MTLGKNIKHYRITKSINKEELIEYLNNILEKE